jgi:hypothetical protein
VGKREGVQSDSKRKACVNKEIKEKVAAVIISFQHLLDKTSKRRESE